MTGRPRLAANPSRQIRVGIPCGCEYSRHDPGPGCCLRSAKCRFWPPPTSSLNCQGPADGTRMAKSSDAEMVGYGTDFSDDVRVDPNFDARGTSITRIHCRSTPSCFSCSSMSHGPDSEGVRADSDHQQPELPLRRLAVWPTAVYRPRFLGAVGLLGYY